MVNGLPNGQTSLVRSYLSLRKSVGIIGVALPFVLVAGGLVLHGTVIQTSVSLYYHTGMRDVFVGSLCAIAVFLWSYRGYERRDNRAGNFACVSALGVALFPTAPGPHATGMEQLTGWLHVLFAAAFFLTLAYFSLALFRLSDKVNPTRNKILRNRVYTLCGYAILACLAGIVVVSLVWADTAIMSLRPVFWLEAAAVVAFGVSWLTKGEAMLSDVRPKGHDLAAPRTAPRIPESEAAT